MINGKHGQGTHSTKMGADKLAENTPNAPKFICPNCLPKPKSLEFWWKKASLGVRSLWLKSWKFMIRSFAIGSWIPWIFHRKKQWCDFRKEFTPSCLKLESHLITHLIFSWHQNLKPKRQCNGSCSSFENISPRNY